MSDFANAQDLVAIDSIRDDTVISKDGSLHQVLIVGGVNFALKSEAEQQVITGAYQSFLNGLNFPAQIIVHSRKINVEKYLASLEERKQSEESALLQNQIAEYTEFIRKFVSDNAIMAKTFFVVVPFVPVGLPSTQTIARFIPFFGKKPTEQAMKGERESNFTENLAQLRQRVDQVINGLAASGLEANPLKTQALIELFYNFYNPETTEKGNVPMEKNQ